MTASRHGRSQPTRALWNLRNAVTHDDAQAQEDLARYVLEQLGAVHAIVEKARDRLGNDASFDAYTDWHRVSRQVQAIFEALQNEKPIAGAQRLGYRVEPWHWSEFIQPIRLAPEVLASGQGNCLEWTLLMAACLLHVKIYPLIFVTQSKDMRLHASLGYWRHESDALAHDRVVIRGQAAASLVEPTMSRAGRRAVHSSNVAVVNATRIPPNERGERVPFERAQKEAETHFPHKIEDQRVLFAVDVRAARKAGIEPLLSDVQVIHNTLKPRDANFQGRIKEKERLFGLIHSRFHIVTLTGLPGVGKTALALDLAHRLLGEMWFDAIVWIDWKTTPSLDGVLSLIARDVFGRSDVAVMSSLDKIAAVRKLLEDNATLLVLDNVASADTDDAPLPPSTPTWTTVGGAAAADLDRFVVEFLQEVPEPSKTLVCARVHSPHIGGFHMLLTGMERAESLELIRAEGRRLGVKSITEAGDDRLAPIHDLSGGLPLAMKLSVGLLDSGLGFVDVETVLGDAASGTGEDFLNPVLGSTWECLSPEARAILQAASLFPAPLHRDALTEIADVKGSVFISAIRRLTRMAVMSAVDEYDDDKRYLVDHPLVRVFAQGSSRLPEAAKTALMDRAAVYFLDLLHEHYRDLEKGYRAIDRNVSNILLILESLHAQGQHARLLDFLERFSYFLFDVGYWRERLDWSQRGYDAAIELAIHDSREFHRAAKCACWTGWFFCRSADYEDAREWAHKAEVCFKKLDPSHREPRVAQLLGMIALGEGDFDVAERCYLEALSGFNVSVEAQTTDEARDDKMFWLATVRTNLGDLAKVRGDAGSDTSQYKVAEDWYRQVFDAARGRCVDNGTGRVYTWDRWAVRLARTCGNLGDLHRRQDDPTSAIRYYEEGYNLAHRVRSRNTRGACAIGLGLVLHKIDAVRSRQLLREGLEVFEQLGSRAVGEKEALREAQMLLRDPGAV